MQTIVQKMNLEKLTDKDLQGFTKLTNNLKAEMWPDDPPRTSDYWQKHFAGLLTFDDWKEHFWLIWNGDETIARAWCGLPYEDNRHLMQIDLYVLPSHRRQGMARGLLAELCKLAEAEKRTLAVFDSSSRVPAGDAFAKAINARFGIESHTNQLVLADLDRDLLRNWREKGEENAEVFEIGCWTGPFPEEHLGAICNLIEIMNTEPRGDLEVEDFKVTPEQIRKQEAFNAKTGTERWHFYARHKASGDFVGYTETGWQKETPTLVWQWGTAVRPEHRGHGLGKWLKAAMLEKILAERPEAKFVRTGNADVNAPMLAINNALGFKPYVAHTAWQCDMPELNKYLSKKES